MTTITVQCDDSRAPLWRILDLISSLLAPDAPLAIGWHPERFNRDVTIMVARDGKITERKLDPSETEIHRGEVETVIGRWTVQGGMS